MTIQLQEGDVLLTHQVDDGEITVSDGVTEMAGGLETCFYLSLFGGNEDDPGGDDVALSYWGNSLENEAPRRYRSETQYLLNTLSLTTGNLQKIEAAAKRDTQWMLDIGFATSVEISASIPGLNKVQFDADVNAEGSVETITFVANWKADSE